MKASLSIPLLVTVTLIVGSWDGRAGAGEDTSLDIALRRHAEALKTGDFAARTLARRTLARTSSSTALAMLMRDYQRPEAPTVLVQCLVAADIARNFQDVQYEEAICGFLRRNATRRDSWLWYLCSREYLKAHGVGSELPWQRDCADVGPEIRAAIEHARACLGDPASLSSVPSLLASISEDAYRQHLVAGHVGPLLVRTRGSSQGLVWREAARAMYSVVGESGLAEPSRLALLRALDVAGASDPSMPPQRGDAPQAVPAESVSFAGIMTSGRRICFLIDNSDSMNMRLRPGEIQDVEEWLGPKISTSVAHPGQGQEGATPDLQGATRWTVAQLALVEALRGLGTSQHYAVLAFASDCVALGQPGFVPATREHVSQTVAAVMRMRCAVPGEVGGGTNLHAGLTMAYGLGAAEGDEERRRSDGFHVPAEHMLDGLDTLFILSDGVPSQDDWTTVSKLGAEEDGTYASRTQLMEELLRLNLFRQAEINVIGIGVRSPILTDMASIGRGRVRWIGAEHPKIWDCRRAAFEVIGCGQVPAHSVWEGADVRDVTIDRWLTLLGSEKPDDVGVAIRQLGIRATSAEATIPALLDAVRKWGAVLVLPVAGASAEIALRDSPQAVVAALDDESQHVRAAAVDALAQMGTAMPVGAREGLLSLAVEDDTVDVRSFAVGALGESGWRDDQGVVRTLVRALGDSSSAVRQTAAWALGRLAPHSQLASESLARALKDPSPTVRAEAESALDRIRNR